MQSELFQSFIDAISSLTIEQREIVNNSLCNTQIVNVEEVEIADNSSIASELNLKNKMPNPTSK